MRSRLPIFTLGDTAVGEHDQATEGWPIRQSSKAPSGQFDFLSIDDGEE
jgi:hypothetical protein